MYPGYEADTQWQQCVFPEDYVAPTPQSRYHIVVIGAGPAGLITAIAAAGLGAKVALVERKQMGGDCLNVGCVPSKALLWAAKHKPFDEAFAWLREVREKISHHDSVERYSQQGVDVFLGSGQIKHGKQVEVTTTQGEKLTLHAKNIVISTGARAATPDIKGIDAVDYYTNENIFNLTEKPESLAILGAGAIGCEMANAFAQLGVKVTLLHAGNHILTPEDADAAEVVQESLEALGVEIITNAMIHQVEHVKDDFTLEGSPVGGIEISHATGHVRAQTLLVAAGRAPNIEALNLSELDIEHSSKGISVNNSLETNVSGIYAIGDVSSKYQFTHAADAQARLIIRNTLFPGKGTTDGMIIPWCTYTDINLARVGLNQKQARAENIKYTAVRVDFSQLDRSQTDDETRGFCEVLVKEESDDILGATIVGEHAGEYLAPFILLMNEKRGLKALNSCIFPYPTRSEIFKRLIDQYNRLHFTPTKKKILSYWLKLIG